MATTTDHADTTTAADDRPLQERAMDAVRSAPEAVRQTVSAVAEKAPDAITASHLAIDEASRRIQAAPAQDLTTWAAFGAGVWVGLLIARAPRLLVLAAGLPALVLAGAQIARGDTPAADAAGSEGASRRSGSKGRAN
jgi:hypothetical protein